MRNFQRIQCFLKVAELESFTAAAKALFITPTAVSKQIKKFEEEIAQQLFIRNPRRVELTDFAQHLYSRCKLLDEHMTEVNQYIESEKSEPRGSLTVMVSTHLSKKFVLRNLKEYVATYPKVHLELLFSEGSEDLARNDIDIMLGYAWPSSSSGSWKSKEMFTIHNILCASPSFVKKNGQPRTIEELSEYDMLSHVLRKPAHTIPLAGNRSIVCSPPVLYMNDFDALEQACIDGIGVLLTGDLMVQESLTEGKLVALLPQLEFLSFDIYLFYRSYEYELAKISTFISFFLERLR